MNVLVTGGAGYIGAHVCKALAEAGHRPVAFDNLSNGHTDAVLWGPLVTGDVRKRAELLAALEAYDCRAVIHLAGLIEVGRSAAEPGPFWDVNVAGTLCLLEAMRDRQIGRLVFSSTAAVYGPHDGQMSETDRTEPASVYGETKLAAEQLIEAFTRAHGIEAFALRYFNAAGADPERRIGEAHHPETHLIPLAIAAGTGAGPPLAIHGDGSQVRDYVHVCDLARAHVAALKAPVDGFEALNLGTGAGYSVAEVVEEVCAALGRLVPMTRGPARPGDPPSLIADSRRAREVLGWTPERSSLDLIVADAAAWARRHERSAA